MSTRRLYIMYCHRESLSPVLQANTRVSGPWVWIWIYIRGDLALIQGCDAWWILACWEPRAGQAKGICLPAGVVHPVECSSNDECPWIGDKIDHENIRYRATSSGPELYVKRWVQGDGNHEPWCWSSDHVARVNLNLPLAIATRQYVRYLRPSFYQSSNFDCNRSKWKSSPPRLRPLVEPSRCFTAENLACCLTRFAT